MGPSYPIYKNPRLGSTMSSSDLSDLSSSLSSDEDIVEPISKGTLEHYFKGKNGSSATPTSPPAKKKRPPSPPHEYVLADNPDIAVSMLNYFALSRCVYMFRLQHGVLMLLTRSSSACSARASAILFPSRYPTMARKISRTVW